MKFIKKTSLIILLLMLLNICFDWLATQSTAEFAYNNDQKHIPMAGENSIFIPGTGISDCFEVSPLVQEEVDTHDIIYSEQFGSDNPFVIGHNYRGLWKLYRTEVNQFIYLSKNGTIETYKVVLSEEASQNESHTDIIGASETSIYKNYGSKTLHLYTCYGWDEDARWIVLAVLVTE